MIPRRIVACLVCGLLLLPIAMVLVIAMGWLLARAGDEAGGGLLHATAFVLGLVWAFDGVCLLLALGVHHVMQDERDESRRSDS